MKRYFDTYQMLLEDWLPDQGIPDSLWRTALYSIIEPSHTIHLYACFKNGYCYRHPLDSLKPYNNCSRDQAIMALCAFHLNGKKLPYLRRKFSDKFKQTFDMIWWLKSLRTGSKRSAWLFLTFWRIALPLLFTWNDILWFHKRKLYWRGYFPMYAFHLLSWMIYCLPDSRAKRKLNWHCDDWIINNDFTNWLLRAMYDTNLPKGFFAGKVGYEAKTDFRWQRRLDRMPPGVRLDPYDGDYPIDVDILKAI